MAVLNKRMVEMEPLNNLQAAEGLYTTIAYSTIFTGTINAILSLIKISRLCF